MPNVFVFLGMRVCPGSVENAQPGRSGYLNIKTMFFLLRIEEERGWGQGRGVVDKETLRTKTSSSGRGFQKPEMNLRI